MKRDGAERSELIAALVEEMESQEATYPRIDEDRLASVAVRLRVAGHGDLDAAVIAWLRARPATARLDIASVVLQFFWRASFGIRAIDPSLVEVLLDARTRVFFQDAAEASALFALADAVGAILPVALRERVLDVLSEALPRPNPHPHLRSTLLRALEEAGRQVRS